MPNSTAIKGMGDLRNHVGFAQSADAFVRAAEKSRGNPDGIPGKRICEHATGFHASVEHELWGAGRFLRTHHDFGGHSPQDRLLWALFGRGRR